MSKLKDYIENVIGGTEELGNKIAAYIVANDIDLVELNIEGFVKMLNACGVPVQLSKNIH